MEDKPIIKHTKSNKNKDMLIVDNKYKMHFIKNLKKDIKLYRCEKYKRDKCPAYIKINGDDLKEYNNDHNHNPDEIKIQNESIRKEIKNNIINSPDPFTIKLPRLYKAVSADKGIRGPTFNSIKSSLYNNINKILPPEIKSFDDIPDNSIYYKTFENEDFLYFKNNKIVFFQSPSLAKIHLKYGDIVFCDGTFYSSPSIAYQLFITRVYDETKNLYYTTSFSLLKGKSKMDYILVFEKLNENINKYLNIGEKYSINELHTDFEIQIGGACRTIFPNAIIKYCIWHLKRSIIQKKNKLCNEVINNNDNLYIFYNMINNLYLCHPDYVVIVFNKIKEQSNNETFNKFLEYFENTFIKKYNVKNWNYFNNFRHITNNACESYNAKLNSLFEKKPTYFKLVYELR